MEYFAHNSLQPMLAAMDSLLTLLVFVVISVAASLLKKKSKGGDLEDWTQESEAPPVVPRRRVTTPQSPPSQPKSSDWEEELRRLLEGEAPSAPPAPPPPIVVYEPPRPRPVAPAVIPAPVRAPERIVKQVTAVDEEGGVRPAMPAALIESARSYQKASQLDLAVAARLEQVTHQSVALTTVTQRKTRSPEVEQIVSLFRNPRTARQAIIASVILGPSKALEGSAYL